MRFSKLSTFIGAVVFFSTLAKGGEVETLCTKLSKDPDINMTKLTVYEVPAEVETPTAIHPELIRKWHTYQYVCDALGSPQEAKFLQVVGGDALPHQEMKNLDCRWLFIITDANGQEKLTMYVDSFFSTAVVNGIWFKPNQEFRKWVNHVFGNAFGLEDTIKND